MPETYNGVPLGEDGRFKPTGKEPTTTITIRLPESLASEIKAIPNRQDWLRSVLSEAVESRQNG